MAAYEKYEKVFTADEVAEALVSMGQTSVPDEWRYYDNVRVRLVPVEEGQRDPEVVGVRVVWWLDGQPQPVKPSPFLEAAEAAEQDAAVFAVTRQLGLDDKVASHIVGAIRSARSDPEERS